MPPNHERGKKVVDCQKDDNYLVVDRQNIIMLTKDNFNAEICLILCASEAEKNIGYVTKIAFRKGCHAPFHQV